MTERPKIATESMPGFPRHVRFEFNEARDCWVILAPERLLMPDETAVAILKRCDGATSVAAIVDGLANDYRAPRDLIEKDVAVLLQDLADKGLIVL